jgi:soluble cytochrome b562
MKGLRMRLPRLFALVTIAAFAAAPGLRAEDEGREGTRPAPATRPAREGRGQDRVSLEHTMEAIGKTYDALRAQVKDKAKAESSLKLVGELQRLVLVAKANPPRGGHLPADKDKGLADYRTMMLNLMRELLSVEEQIAGGKLDDAADTLDAIKKMQEAGHQEFNVH